VAAYVQILALNDEPKNRLDGWNYLSGTTAISFKSYHRAEIASRVKLEDGSHTVSAPPPQELPFDNAATLTSS
jgi:hypothetical protein